MTDRVRLAVVGAGRMGRFHIQHLDGLDGIEVAAVADPDPSVWVTSPGRAEADWRHLIGRRDIDGWLVASPTSTHSEIVAAAIDLGVPVLCEKPLSLDPEQSRALGRRAAGAGVVLQIGFWRRFSLPWVAARRVIQEGHIGVPVYLRLSQWDANPPPPAFCDPAVSGGLAVDCGVHEFDLAEWLTGHPIAQIEAWSPPSTSPEIVAVGDVETMVVRASLSDGTVATVDLTRHARYGDDVRTEILGTDGALFVDLLPTGRTRVADRDGVRVVDGSECDDAMSAGVVAQAKAFAARVRGEPIAVPGAEESARATAAGLAAAGSLSTGRPIDLRADPPGL